MIINHYYKFIFIHIHKTAGTSIEQVLMDIPGSVRIGHKHSSYRDLKIYGMYSNYFIFSFVRNPWDRLVSWYVMLDQLGSFNNFSSYIKNNAQTFEDFIQCTDTINETILDHDFTSIQLPYYKSISINQIDYLSDEQGIIRVHFIGRFENLCNDFEIIKQKIGLPQHIQLPHINSFKRKEYHTYYSFKTKEYVHSLYKRDCDFFEYSFLNIL